MYSRLLKKFVPVPKIENFENYLFIGPHPDDIEVACAPTVAKLVSMGKKVTFLVATDGRVGTTDPALADGKLVEIRKNEAVASAKFLGAEVEFLEFPDGGLYSAEDLTKALTQKIVGLKPQAVFAPDPKTRSECHPDHIKTGEAALAAVTMSGFCGFTKLCGTEDTHSVSAVALYHTDKPNCFVKIDKFSKVRTECLALHPSQFSKTEIGALQSYFSLRERGLGFMRMKGRVDAYRVMAPMHMHCIPEASKW